MLDGECITLFFFFLSSFMFDNRNDNKKIKLAIHETLAIDFFFSFVNIKITQGPSLAIASIAKSL